jgi:hypothetical protein
MIFGVIVGITFEENEKSKDKVVELIKELKNENI